MAQHPPRRAGELAGELERAELDGEPCWTTAGDTTTPRQPHRGIRLLPHFDAFVVAGQPRQRLYPGAAATRGLTPAGQAGNYPVLLVDGVVGGCGTSGAPLAGSPSPSNRCAS
jgi:Winged helix DNA-binding domain